MASKARQESPPLDASEELTVRDIFVWSATRLWGFWALSCVITAYLMKEPLMLRQSWHESK